MTHFYSTVLSDGTASLLSLLHQHQVEDGEQRSPDEVQGPQKGTAAPSVRLGCKKGRVLCFDRRVESSAWGKGSLGGGGIGVASGGGGGGLSGIGTDCGSSYNCCGCIGGLSHAAVEGFRGSVASAGCDSS